MTRFGGSELLQPEIVQARIEAAIGRADALDVRAFAAELLAQVRAGPQSHQVQVFGLLLAAVALLSAAIESEKRGATVEPKL